MAAIFTRPQCVKSLVLVPQIPHWWRRHMASLGNNVLNPALTSCGCEQTRTLNRNLVFFRRKKQVPYMILDFRCPYLSTSQNWMFSCRNIPYLLSMAFRLIINCELIKHFISFHWHLSLDFHHLESARVVSWFHDGFSSVSENSA